MEVPNRIQFQTTYSIYIAKIPPFVKCLGSYVCVFKSLLKKEQKEAILSKDFVILLNFFNSFNRLGQIKMRTLVIVRHGNYGKDLHLDDSGRADIARLAVQLNQYINGGSIRILTSPVDRAQESAHILGMSFGVDPQPHELLWSDNNHDEDLPAALELVRTQGHGVDALLLVTHYEYVGLFPEYFGKQELGVSFPIKFIEKGEAWVIDYDQKTVVHVR